MTTIRELVLRVVMPEDPGLARRILALVWAYERGALRHRLLKEPLRRRKGERDHNAAHEPTFDTSSGLPFPDRRV